MTRRRRLHQLPVLACALALAACGSAPHARARREHPDPDLSGPQRIVAPPPAAIAPNPAPAAVALQSATPTGTITAYATAFARTSSAQLPARESTLLAYSSPPYAASLRSSYPSARAQTARALPDHAAMTGAVEALALRAHGPRTYTGVVAISQSLQLPAQPPQQPVTVDYSFTIAHLPTGWRVASFVPIVAP
jgi:hypothetical protein